MCKMNKNIKVSKISLDALDKLQKAGFVVEIGQVTIRPANPRHYYELADTISALKKDLKQGIVRKIKPKPLPTKLKALQTLSDNVRVERIRNEKT